MATFTLHVPPGSYPGEIAALEDARLVRDGFSWGAFVFSFLWFFWNRLWLAGIAVLIGVIALQIAVSFLPIGPLAPFWSLVLYSLLVGLEASSLERWTHERRGRAAVALVSARNEAEAEEKSFSQWLDQRTESVPHPAPLAVSPSNSSPAGPALGLFPIEERRR
jgi:hypothetical protein